VGSGRSGARIRPNCLSRVRYSILLYFASGLIQNTAFLPAFLVSVLFIARSLVGAQDRKLLPLLAVTPFVLFPYHDSRSFHSRTFFCPLPLLSLQPGNLLFFEPRRVS